MCKTGVVTDLHRRYLELRKPFTRFKLPTPTNFNATVLAVCNKFNDEWHAEGDSQVASSSGSKSPSQSPARSVSQTPPRSVTQTQSHSIDFGGFLGINTQKKRPTTSSPDESDSNKQKTTSCSEGIAFRGKFQRTSRPARGRMNERRNATDKRDVYSLLLICNHQ